MIIIYLNDIINVNFNLYKEIIVNIKMLKRFNVVNKLNYIFKRKFKRYHFLKIKFTFINVMLYFFLCELRF